MKNLTEPIYVGIDPGLDGALVAITAHTLAAIPVVVPTFTQSKSTKRMYDIRGMVKELEWMCGAALLVALEKGRAAPGQGVTSMFRFGYGCGLWEGILAALKLPYVLVHPNSWQKEICRGLSGDPKTRAVMAASSFLPTLELKKSDRATKPHQGIADAACLALYSRMVHLGKIVGK